MRKVNKVLKKLDQLIGTQAFISEKAATGRIKFVDVTELSMMVARYWKWRFERLNRPQGPEDVQVILRALRDELVELEQSVEKNGPDSPLTAEEGADVILITFGLLLEHQLDPLAALTAKINKIESRTDRDYKKYPRGGRPPEPVTTAMMAASLDDIKTALGEIRDAPTCASHPPEAQPADDDADDLGRRVPVVCSLAERDLRIQAVRAEGAKGACYEGDFIRKLISQARAANSFHEQASKIKTHTMNAAKRMSESPDDHERRAKIAEDLIYALGNLLESMPKRLL